MSSSADTGHAGIAERLLRASATRVPIAPISQNADLTVADAYAIQEHWAALRRAEGRRVVGRKVGLTSKAMQDALGVDQPDFGHLFDDMLLPNGGTVDLGGYIAARAEPETAFRLEHELSGPGVTADDVREAIDEAYPSLEIIDSRIADWKIALVDTVADNASSAAVVLGEPADWRDLDLGAIECQLSVDGAVVETGLGSAVLGHPFNAVAWLANTLGEFGTPLAAGDIVLPGSCTRAVPLEAGKPVHADFGALGTVQISVEDRTA
jgi:2-keto-4-pentenoate hydratase